MNAHIILCNDKKNFAEVDINNLQEINYIDIINAEKNSIKTDFANKFDLRNLYEANFIGKNDSFIVKADKIAGVKFVNE